MYDIPTLVACGVLTVGVLALLVQVISMAFKVRKLEALVFITFRDEIEKAMDEYENPDN